MYRDRDWGASGRVLALNAMLGRTVITGQDQHLRAQQTGEGVP